MAYGRKTGGRKAGTLNKATFEVKEAARQYAPDALQRLHLIMQTGESDAAKVSAAREILDRAYGKPSQAIMAEIDQSVKVSGTLCEADQRLMNRYVENEALEMLVKAGLPINRTKTLIENFATIRDKNL